MKPRIEIGCRWQPRVIYRCDSEAGIYELVNSPVADDAIERSTQKALLLELPARVERRIEAIRKLRSPKQ